MFNFVLIGTQITSLTDDSDGSTTMFFVIMGIELVCMFLFTYFIIKIAKKSLSNTIGKYTDSGAEI